jgi:PrtD family type I secretion system ABC transporter
MKRFLKKWLKYFVFAGVFSLGVNILYLTFPLYMLAIYDRVLSSFSVPTLITLTAGALFALLVLGCLDLLRSRLLVQAGVAMDESLSPTVLKEMLKDSARIQKQGYAGGLRDVNTLRNYFAGNAIFSLFDLPWTPIYLAVIYMMHPVLGLTATAGAVAIFLLGLLQDFLTRKRYDQSQAIGRESQQYITSSLRHAEVARSMSMIGGILEHWKGLNNQVMLLQTQANRHAGLLQAITKSLRMSMQVLIYGVGAYYVIENQATAGSIIAASIIMGRALAPVDQVIGTWRQTVDARGAYKRLDALLHTAAEEESMDLPAPTGKLDVEKAGLAVAGTQILGHISFSLQPGEHMGLIGPSGAGKTSLCRLLLGIWPSRGGKVRLDGADVYSWNQEELGKYIGYLPQEVELFPGTVSDNIARLGQIDSEKVVQAAKKAGVHELILRLPLGYDTEIGEGGASLSGGQRQRIGLARALYGDPAFIVLDEPNSNLDDAGERALMQTLKDLRQNETTVILVTHKPALLSGVDKVLMLKEGQVAMFGPRQEVLQRLMGQQPGQTGQQPSGPQGKPQISKVK